MLDLPKFVSGVHDHIKRALAPLARRIEELEKRAPVPGPKGDRGDAGAPGAKGLDGAAGRDGANGKDGAKGEDGAPGREGRDGKDGAVGPAGKDGAPGERGARGEKGEPGIAGKDGAPGINGKDATVDEDGIVARVTARIPIPKDGRDGRDGAPGAEGSRGSDGLNGKDGQDGKDGLNGLSVDDFEVSLDGRTFTFALRCGERVVEKQIKVPFPINRGTLRPGAAYEKGDVLMFGGSQWMSLKDDNRTKPPGDAWQLCVQRGRDGKDAE